MLFVTLPVVLLLMLPLDTELVELTLPVPDELSETLLDRLPVELAVLLLQAGQPLEEDTDTPELDAEPVTLPVTLELGGRVGTLPLPLTLDDGG